MKPVADNKRDVIPETAAKTHEGMKRLPGHKYLAVIGADETAFHHAARRLLDLDRGHALERPFDHEAAHRIMMHVHQHGIGECGVFTYEVAETKVTQVMDFARKHQHPLQCIMEKK